MELSEKKIDGFQFLIIYVKSSILDVWLDSECAFAYIDGHLI